MKYRIIWLAVVAMASPTDSSAKEPPLLLPSTPWKVDFDDGGCSIERRFGASGSDVTVRMLRRGVTGGVDILVLGPLVERTRGRPELTMAFEPQGVSQSLDPYAVKLKGQDAHFLRGFENGFVNAFEWSNSQIVRLKIGQQIDVRMDWPNAKSAFAVLQQCDDDLHKDKGIDMAAVRAQKSGPIPQGNPGRWMTDQDYPENTRAEGGIGEVIFELTVDPAGKVASCRNLMRSGWLELDEIVCKTVSDRAKFSPAISGNGTPTTGYYVNRVRFQWGRQ